MRVFVVTNGMYSEYYVEGVADTQEKAVIICDKLGNKSWSPQIMLFDDDKHLATWSYQSGGFVDGQLKLIWEYKKC